MPELLNGGVILYRETLQRSYQPKRFLCRKFGLANCTVLPQEY